MKSIARLFVATAAGAGLGAGAALVRRHFVGSAPGAPATSGSEAAEAVPAAPGRSATDVADLDAARIRLRERAAALRAEMEGRTGVP